MDELIRWYSAILDEVEQIARACPGDGKWYADGIAFYAHDLGPEVQAHIVVHDPARVLREVEAGRRLLGAHAKWCVGECEVKYPEASLDAAHYWNIKLRAAVYSDRPGYREEWRP